MADSNDPLPGARPAARNDRGLLLGLFAVSGFTGLIYESIWAQYMGLMLGHAAYAQTLVLAIFMGGMALGAWLAGRRSERWQNPLLAYAVVEGLVGLLAIAFHGTFVTALDALYGSWIPALGHPGVIAALKWSVAAALILPQSLLLGTTFPLISAALIRRDRTRSGATLGLLYFANSLGAAGGALAGGFFLVARLGLPGTILAAGLANVALAAVVWTLARRRPTPPVVAGRPDAAAGAAGTVGLWPLAALVTGAASFSYEIGWIRMLNLVLGTTTQSFELMLSAFLTGLAFGGLWIRRRLDGVASPLRLAGRIQVLMGLAALLTIPLYGATFGFMELLLTRLPKDAAGYALFNLGSHAVALAIMLPATILAGMTLPVFTFALLRRGQGEGAIGRIYAANTVGAIVGVLAAVHLIMPAVGTRGLIVLGAGADIALGLFLLGRAAERGSRRVELPAAAALAAVAIALVLFAVDIDPRRAASGVYRHGRASLPAGSEVVFHRDGKTATIDLIRTPDGLLKISTNGKPDAELDPDGRQPAPDEITQVLLGALPLSVRPDARLVANIGLGSGMTTHTVLGSDRVRRVDTIEIEAAVVEAARAFGPAVQRAYTDPRSRIHVEDAKTFFSSRRERYDVIISEPSNPWVSGVAGLFSAEFYAHVRRHLAADGLLVQWLQLYETDTDLLASIFKALASEFDDYTVFNTDNANILILATNGTAVGAPDPAIFRQAALARDLARVGILTVEDLEIRRIGSRRLLQPLFDSHGAPMNSDYFPYVGHHAPRSRYLGRTAVDLTRLHVAPIPVLELLDPARRPPGPGARGEATGFTPAGARAAARDVIQALGRGSIPAGEIPHPGLREALPALLAHARPRAPAATTAAATAAATGTAPAPIDEPRVLQGLLALAGGVNPFLGPAEADALWREIATWPGLDGLSATGREWLALHHAAASRDTRAMLERATHLLDTLQEPSESGPTVDPAARDYLVAAGLTAALAEGRPDAAGPFAALEGARPAGVPRPFHLSLLLSRLAADTPPRPAAVVPSPPDP